MPITGSLPLSRPASTLRSMRLALDGAPVSTVTAGSEESLSALATVLGDSPPQASEEASIVTDQKE
jgi:hypothetical protein